MCKKLILLTSFVLVLSMASKGWPSSNPDPPDGATYSDTFAMPSCTPGATAASHNVYFGDNFDEVDNGTGDTFLGNQSSTMFIVGFAGFPYPEGLVPGTTYYWRIDDVEADGTTIHKGDVWSFSIPSRAAYNPDPADGAESVALDVILSWTPGFRAIYHTVYFGDDFDTVSNATEGFLRGTATFTPPGLLEPGKTYYWRVDEFKPGSGTHKGEVWSFTTADTMAPPVIDNIVLEQVNWYGPDGSLAQENSLWGRMLYEYQPGDDQTYYLNLAAMRLPGAEPAWVTQNAPLFPVDNDDYSMRREALDINLEELGITGGQDLSEIYCTWSVDGTIRTEPPTGPETLYVVGDSDRFAWCPIGESPDPAPFTGAGVPVGVKLDQPAVKESKSRDVKAVQEGDNKCFAGSCARSIDWLNREHELGIDKGAQDIYDDLIAADVSQPNADGSTARDEWIAAKNKYAREQTDGKIVTKVWDPGDLGFQGFPNGMVDPIEGVSETNGDFATWLKNELKHGEDVELAYYWSESAHIVTVLEVYTSGGDTYVKYRDDEKQGDNTKGDTHVKDKKVYKKDGKWHFGSDSNTIYFAVSESADKDKNGIGDGFEPPPEQAMIIDEFLGDGLLAVVSQDSVFPVKDGMTIPDHMVGGELEVVLNLLYASMPGDGMFAEIKDGSLNLMVDSSCTGQVVLAWDGKGDSWDSVNATSGLDGIDITQGGTQNGIEVSILNNVSPTDLSLVLFSTVDDSSEMTQTIAPTTVPITVEYLFEDFVPNGNGADWQSIQAIIVAMLDMTGPEEIEIDFIRTTPASPADYAIFSIDDVELLEGDGVTEFVFTVTLEAPTATEVTLDFTTVDGTAAAGIDYQAASGTVTFFPGETARTITVSVLGDRTPEPDETFFVNLSNPSNGTILDNQGVGTILNDDVEPPTEILIDFEQWTVGTLFDKDSFLQFYPELEGYVEINTEGPLFQVVDTSDGKVLEAGAGRIGDDEFQSFEIRISSLGGGICSFRDRTDCEEDYDFLTLSVNGEEQCRLSGQTPWTPCEVDIPPELCTVKCEYFKDGSVSKGQDNAQVDDIIISVVPELSPIVVLVQGKRSQAKSWFFARANGPRMSHGLFMREQGRQIVHIGSETGFLPGQID